MRSLAAPLAINLTVFVNYSIWVVLPLYVQHEFSGASAERVATLLMIITVVHLVASPVAAVIRRRGSQVVVVGAAGGFLLGTLPIPQMPGLLWLIVPLTLYGVGQVAAVNAGGDIILRRGEGTSTAVGLVRLSSDFGLVLGPVIAGALADWLGYRAPFYALSLTLAVAIVVSLTRIREPTRTVSKRVRWTKGVH
ncbi:MAG: MFS transporter [Thermomicrobiales bacterium]